ncbi:MAG: hypothetical protein U9O53_05460 [archaeon]|nr:hypothetical protein [archaeon]
MRISKIRDVEEKNIPGDGYPIFSIDGRKVDSNGLESDVAAGVYSLLKLMYNERNLDGGLSSRNKIVEIIKTGCEGHPTPAYADVAKKFPGHISNYLLNVS